MSLICLCRNRCRMQINAESIDTDFKSQKWKSKKLVCFFLIALFILRPIDPSRSESVKLAGSDKKRICLATSFQGNLPFVYGQVSSFTMLLRENLLKLKNIHLGKFWLIYIYEHFFWFVYTRLQSFILV